MKLQMQTMPMSVQSEVEVKDMTGAVLFRAKTDPLSSPRCTLLFDADGRERAKVTTVRLDYKDRAHHVTMADGRTFELTRKFRVSASTTESILTVSGLDWKIATRRAWTSRFEIRSASGNVLAEARQIAARRGDVYEIDLRGEDRTEELVLCCLIARYVIREDAPVGTGV